MKQNHTAQEQDDTIDDCMRRFVIAIGRTAIIIGGLGFFAAAIIYALLW